MGEKISDTELSEYLQWLYFEDVYDFSDMEICNNRKMEDKKTKDKPLFSFMMAVYNDMSLFNSAVSSLLKQNFADWELLILDNSNQNDMAWETIQNAVKMDSRIRAYKSNENVGWAKGAAILLDYVQGTYVTFLAADDCINMGSLDRLEEIARTQEPDVIWVGYMFVNCVASKIQFLGANCPPYKIYGEMNRSETIVDIMHRIDYNTFFHYMRVDFLKQQGIDFFEPYYADCGEMTKCMTASRKMALADVTVYCLTRNTSQTVGYYVWDAFDFMFANQWRCIREVFQKEQYSNPENIAYTAKRILNNLFGNISSLCCGRCRNKYMNPIEKTEKEIVDQLEAIMLCDDIVEMIQICGSSFGKLLSALSNLVNRGLKPDSTVVQHSWLRPLFILAMGKKDIPLIDKINYLTEWLLTDYNAWCVGFDYYVNLLGALDDNTLTHYKQDIDCIIEKYDSAFEKWEWALN